MFPSGLEDRCRRVLEDLLEFGLGAPTKQYDRLQVSGTKDAQINAAPPPGVNLGLDGEKCPPISISPYHHFCWQFKHAEHEDQALGFLHAAERLQRRLRNPISAEDMSQMSEESRAYVAKGQRSGEEIAEKIIGQYAEYDSDTVDIIENLKPGTTRRVRRDNFLDDLGNPRSGVPKHLYDEFELLDSIGGREAVLDRFQIAQSTYYDIRAKIRKQADAA